MATTDDPSGIPAAEWAPPSWRSLEPELVGPPPRPLSASLAEGPYARGRRTATVALLATGLVSLVVAEAPWVDRLALYLLPLGYLEWIGIACLVGAAVAPLERRLARGRYRYVRDGVVLTARILDLVKAPAAIVNGQAIQYAFRASILLEDPESRELVVAETASEPFSAEARAKFETPFKIGDYATAIYLPPSLEKTLRLYAFLDLSPVSNLRRSPAPAAGSPWKIALSVLAIVGLFAVMVGNLYSFGRFHPLDFDYVRAWPLLTAGGLLGVGGFVALVLQHRRQRDRIERDAATAVAEGRAVELTLPFLGGGAMGWFLRVVVALGLVAMGALTVVCWALALNAGLDRSPSRATPATVVEMTRTTHALLFRDYSMKLRVEGFDEPLDMLTTPQTLDALLGSPEAIASLRNGRFGWTWVEGVAPLPGGRADEPVARGDGSE